jgi:hypothetical protein
MLMLSDLMNNRAKEGRGPPSKIEKRRSEVVVDEHHVGAEPIHDFPDTEGLYDRGRGPAIFLLVICFSIMARREFLTL